MPPEVNVNQNYPYNPYIMEYLKNPIKIDNQQSGETNSSPNGLNINVFQEAGLNGYNVGYTKTITPFDQKNTTIDFSSNHSYSENSDRSNPSGNLTLGATIKTENPDSKFFVGVNSSLDKNPDCSSLTNSLSVGYNFGKKIDPNLNAQVSASASFTNLNNSGEVNNVSCYTGGLKADYTIKSSDINGALKINGNVLVTKSEMPTKTDWGAGVSISSPTVNVNLTCGEQNSCYTNNLAMDYTRSLNTDTNIKLDGYIGITGPETFPMTKWGAGVSLLKAQNDNIRLGYEEINCLGDKNSTYTLSYKHTF